ncbi:hypothetical protein ACVNPS_02205 [Candidatus Bipolaricaulota sp. J31]
MAETACVVAAAPSTDIVGRVRVAATKWLFAKLQGLGAEAKLFVLTPEVQGWEGVEVVPTPGKGFRWGEALVSFVERVRPCRLLYFSAGSGFLLDEGDLARILTLDFPEPFAVLNNFYSTDFALICPPRAEVFRGLPNDNALGWRLWELGYRCFELPRNARTQFDIDTPGELQVLACKADLPPTLAEELRPIPRAEALLSALVEPGRRVTLLGRVSGHLLRFLDRKAACRTRVLSEARGMKAEGRQERFLILRLYEALGPEGLVAELSRASDVVVWDVRVLFAGLGIWPPPEERFSFDLLDEDGVVNPTLRELVEAIKRAEAPFLLGGHTLVSGAMYLAVELAWRRTDWVKGLVRLEEDDETELVEIRPR